MKNLLLLLLLLIATRSEAAITVVQESIAQAQMADVNVATTAGADFTGSTLIVCSVAATGTPTTIAVTDSETNTWVGLTAEEPAGEERQIQLFYDASPATDASQTFTATTSGGDGFPGIHCIGLAGTAASPFDQESGNSTATDGDTLQPGSITPSQNNEICVVAGFIRSPGGTVSIDGGFSTPNQIDAAADGYGIAVSYLIQTTAAAANPTLTWTVEQLSLTVNMACFKAAGAGTSAVPIFYSIR